MEKLEFYNVYPKHPSNAGIAKDSNLEKDNLFFLPHSQPVVNWVPLQCTIIRGMGFYDFQVNTHGLRLLSQQMKDIIDSNKSVNDKVQWLGATVSWNDETRPYYVLHFYDVVDVMNYELSGWDGKFFNKSKVFDREKIRNHNVFSIPEWGYDLSLVVKHPVMKEIKKQKLTGVSFGFAEIN